MANRSTRWKWLERKAAKMLGGKRILRGGDFSKSDPDVEVADFPELQIDAKAYARFAHHTLMAEIEEKYCTEPNHVPILVTKHKNQQGEFVTVPLWWLAELLDRIRIGEEQ